MKSLFSPLASQHSEIYSLCICELYSSFYGPNADYSATHQAESLKHIIHGILDSNQELCLKLEVVDKKAKSNDVFNLLVKHEWLESYEDKASLTKYFRFTREGKVLGQTLFELSNGFYTRKSRAVRSTKSALESFYKERSVEYLLDAWIYSSQIMQEFEELINEIHEKRKLLLQSMATSEAVEIFLSEMQRKERDLQHKLKTDSVLKYSDAIHKLIDSIEHEFPPSFWDVINTQIQQETGTLFEGEEHAAFFMLGKIRSNIEVAIEKKNPELTQALNFFIKRTRSLLKTSINLATSGDELKTALERYRSQSNEEKLNTLGKFSEKLQYLKVRVWALDKLVIPKKVVKEVQTEVETKEIPKFLQNRSKLTSKVNEKIAVSALQTKKWVKEKIANKTLTIEKEDMNNVMGVMMSSMFLDGLKANNLIGIVSDKEVEGLVTATQIDVYQNAKEFKSKGN